MYSTTKQKKLVQIFFYVRDNEYQACNFLVAFFLDTNMFFIVPKKDLKSSLNGKRWRFLVKMNKSGQPHPVYRKYLNAWHLIHSDFIEKSPENMLEQIEEEVSEEE